MVERLFSMLELQSPASQTDEIAAQNSKFFFSHVSQGQESANAQVASVPLFLYSRCSWHGSLGVGLESLLGRSVTWLQVRSCSSLGVDTLLGDSPCSHGDRASFGVNAVQGSVPRKTLQ